ncbi:hypothetical protein K501DRAFT_279928 [Backusella circina FSU 941]|nr:hypothetical protein K501DRAFT_279928 [Backusella circina FSU 941]
MDVLLITTPVTTGTVIHMLLKEPPPPAPNPEKRIANTIKNKDVEMKIVGENEQDEIDPKTVSSGITSTYYVKFIGEVLDLMDEIGDIKRYYHVMDNCKIHKNKYIQRKIQEWFTN